MSVLTLTARVVEQLPPASPGDRHEYFDQELPGLTLRVTERGAKTWTVMYRHRGRLRRLTLGSASILAPAAARARARDVLYAAGKGSDPATEKSEGRSAETLQELAKLYIDKHARPRKRSWRADRNLLDRKILPRWRHRAIVDITRRDCLGLVEAVAEAGAPVVANRVAALISKLFSFALDRGLIETHIAQRLPRPGVERQRDRVLSDEEIRTLWGAWEQLAAPMAAFYRLRLLTAQRGGEVASMRWQDVDLDAGWWTIPATSSKNKLAHRVPLNASALRILATILATADEDAIYVVGATQRAKGTGARGKRQQAEAAKTFGVENFRGHDLRRTAASTMASGGIPRLTISKILNHVERSVTAVYDRHSYDSEKQAALAWWDARLESILKNKTADILAFGRIAV
jgi:integrase